jgi:hypothetical protein
MVYTTESTHFQGQINKSCQKVQMYLLNRQNRPFTATTDNLSRTKSTKCSKTAIEQS